MTFKEQLVADLAVFFNADVFAESVEYNGKAILAIPEIGETDAKGNTFDSSGSSSRAYFYVKAMDIPTPMPGDVIVYRGDWQVTRIVEADTCMYKLETIANESPFSMR